MNRVTALILAAGQASRMGQSKQLLPWGDRSILGQTIENTRRSTVDEIVVVTGAYREGVEAVAASAGVRAVHNADFAAGEMLSSLQVGLSSLSPEPDGILVMLADLPFIPPALIDQIVYAFRAEPTGLVAPVYQGRRGHPVLIGRALFRPLLDLPIGDAPRTLFKRHADQLTRVEVDSEVILLDIDTPEEYERLRPQ